MGSFNQVEGVVAPTDVFVATPMDEEWRALLSVFGSGRELPMRGGRTFYGWAYPSAAAPRYLLAGAAMGSIGQTEMSAFATDFLSRWSPRNVAIVGIAGSFED